MNKLFGVDKTVEKAIATQRNTIQRQVTADFMLNMAQQIWPTWTVFKEIEWYRITEDVYSVVDLLAATAAGVPFYAFDRKNDTFLADAHPLEKLLRSLTYEDRLQIYTFLFISKEAFLYKEKIEFGPTAGVRRLRIMHPNNMTIVKDRLWPHDTLGYIYRDPAQGVELKFLNDEIIYIKGPNPINDYQKAARGLSPISVLSKVLNRLSAGLDRSTAMLQNGGVPGIIYDKLMDFSTEKSGLRRENFSRFAANPANAGAPYFGSGEMGYLPLGLNMVDLDLAALAGIDFDKICNVYHVSARLFNKDGTGSEVSDDNAHEALYNHATLPTVRLFLEGLTKGLAPDVPGADAAEIRQDISEIRVLQADQLKLAQAMAASPVIIPNEVRLTLGQDAIKDKLMDKVYIKQGYQLLDDLQAVPPIDERDNDDEDQEEDES